MKRQKQKERPPPLRLQQQQEHPKQVRRPVEKGIWQVQRAAAAYRQQPVIIHTFSPEVIHTEAQNFMDLVQRLTGQASQIVSPVAKRARSVSLQQHAAPAPGDIPQPVAMRLQEEESPLPRETLWCASESVFSPQNLRLALARSPRFNAKSVFSPSASRFEFSPSLLPSPSTFLCDFQSLLSPLRPSPRLAMPVADGAKRQPAPPFPSSPGPFTSAFLADLPVLSPAACHTWIPKHPLSAEYLLLSPLPQALHPSTSISRSSM